MLAGVGSAPSVVVAGKPGRSVKLPRKAAVLSAQAPTDPGTDNQA